MSSRGKVLMAAPVHQVLNNCLTEAGYELFVPERISQQIAHEAIHDCVGVITSTRLQLDRALLDAAPKLKWIGRMGSGMEVIDVPYANNKGIHCFSSPEGNCNAVAEHALGLLLGITKRIAHSRQEVINGLWLREENRGIELEGKTIAIIGFGHTGRAFVRKLQCMDMEILVFDKNPLTDAPDYVSVCQALDSIQERADIISFHVPLAADTQHYFNTAFLEKCRKPIILLNTSRGVVVDCSILPEALASGKIVGIGLDVWEEEPLDRMRPEMRDLLDKIANHPQVILTPHIAGYTKESLYKMSNVLAEKILKLKV